MTDLFSPAGTSLCILTDETGAVVQIQVTRCKAVCDVPAVKEAGYPGGCLRFWVLPGIGGPRAFPPFRLNGSALENDAFSDKSERENADDSDAETQDHSRKTNESGSDLLDSPGGPRRGTTYVEQVQEELGEVRALSTQSGNGTQQGSE